MKEKNQKLGFWSIVLLTINGVIGTGIFLSPGSVAKQVGSIAPEIYFCAALFAACLAVTFASASRYVVKSGAAYAYTEAAFGESVGLYVGTTRFVAASIAWGVMATGVVKTALQILRLDTSKVSNVTLGFLCLMVILLIINACGMRVFRFVSNLSTVGKLGALVLTVAAGLFLILTTGVNRLAEVELLTNDAGQKLIPALTTSGFVTAVISAFYAFTGFESVASGSGDMENPEKNLPRALPLAIGIIAFIYCGIVFVAMRIDPVSLVTSKDVVVLAAVFPNPLLKGLIVGGALISMFGINVAASFLTPRVLEAMASDGLVPKIFAKRTESGVPIYSFLLTVALAIIIPMAFQYDMRGIMIISSISRFVQFVLVPLAVITFYYGKNRGRVIANPKKNFVLDVPFSLLSLGLTVFLLAKFKWAAQFSLQVDGKTVPNYYAIVAMFIGYIVLPAGVYFYRSRKKA